MVPAPLLASTAPPKVVALKPSFPRVALFCLSAPGTHVTSQVSSIDPPTCFEGKNNNLFFPWSVTTTSESSKQGLSAQSAFRFGSVCSDVRNDPGATLVSRIPPSLVTFSSLRFWWNSSRRKNLPPASRNVKKFRFLGGQSWFEWVLILGVRVGSSKNFCLPLYFGRKCVLQRLNLWVDSRAVYGLIF